MAIADRKKREKQMLEQMRIEMIQQAAEDVFVRKGFQAATIEDIAHKAELSPAAIYLYFKSKDDLYASLNLITLEYLYDRIAAVEQNASLSVQEKILGFKDAFYDTYRFRPLILKIILHIQLNSLTSLSPDLMDKLNDVSRRIMVMIAGVYRSGVEKGVFLPGHENAHADIIWSVFTGLVLWEEAKRQLHPDKNFLQSTLDRAFEIFLRGVSVDPNGGAS